MDAIVGKFKVRIDRGSVVLTHPTGISFDLTPEEALGFGDIIKVYRETLLDTVHKQQEEPQKNLYKDREPVLQFRSGEQNGKN